MIPRCITVSSDYIFCYCFNEGETFNIMLCLTHLKAVNAGKKRRIVERKECRISALRESVSALPAVEAADFTAPQNQLHNLHYCKSCNSLLTVLEISLETLHCSLFYCYSGGLSNVNI